MTTVGVGYSQNGGWGGNISCVQYNQYGGWNVDPSINVSYTFYLNGPNATTNTTQEQDYKVVLEVEPDNPQINTDGMLATPLPIPERVIVHDGSDIIVVLVGDYDIDKAVATLDKNAKSESTGHCAKYVRYALEGGGMKTNGRPEAAKDYGPFLMKKGFVTVDAADYDPSKGDIVVMQSVKGHPYGHIQMYNGTQWISDFRQPEIWPASVYRNNKPSYTIFRW